uniref:Reverse transcriptase domain-containing protein n=1 Tax=Tanacetum cinerariifolium TaxID=118510 RepID=A0A6L2P7D7_TANCI|nr:hypothetical protein [Tanacetum cinerariifolium]
MSIEINKKKELRQLEQAANLSTYSTKPSRCYNSYCYDDDDYEESTIPFNKIISQIHLSVVITSSPPVLPIEDSEDSLIMGNEELSTVPKKESDEFIKSSVEDLVPLPSESKDTSGSDSEYDLSSCDGFSPIDVPEGKSVTFSNHLFDSDDDFTSSDDELLSDEDEVLENIENNDSYDFNLDEPNLLVIPISDTNEDECFDPRDINEIDAFLETDVSTDIKDGYYDSKGDIIYLENLLTYDTILSLLSEMFLDHDPKGLKDEPNDDD